jgi:hypothetical protein
LRPSEPNTIRLLVLLLFAGRAHRGGMAANVFSMLSSTASVDRTPTSM